MIFFANLLMEACMAEQPVYSDAQVDFGNNITLQFYVSGGNLINAVPPNKILDIATLTLNYFPIPKGTVGRADIAGRNSSNNAVWRLQIVYVEPMKTLHLPFPNALRLEAGGYVQIGFINDGPGSISISANGRLVDI
jgi:hypothetical protein